MNDKKSRKEGLFFSHHHRSEPVSVPTSTHANGLSALEKSSHPTHSSHAIIPLSHAHPTAHSPGDTVGRSIDHARQFKAAGHTGTRGRASCCGGITTTHTVHTSAAFPTCVMAGSRPNRRSVISIDGTAVNVSVTRQTERARRGEHGLLAL